MSVHKSQETKLDINKISIYIRYIRFFINFVFIDIRIRIIINRNGRHNNQTAQERQ